MLFRSDASGARFAVIIGEDEVKTGVVVLKPLRTQAEQISLPLAQVAAMVRNSVI